MSSIDVNVPKDEHYQQDLEWRLERDGDLDLAFKGRVIGFGEHGNNNGPRSNWTRGTYVTLFRTVSNTYIARVHQWTQWDGESSVTRCAVSNAGADLLLWLKDDAGGKLGPASKEAWEDACSNDDTLEDLDVERVA